MAFDSSSFSYYCILVFCFMGMASASGFLSDGVLVSRGASARTLLQATKSCPVDFEHQNYTILTTQCKGPQYAPNLCCTAFKQFACPFAADLNDLTNDCATTMFSYINLYGKYPPGLFANECRDGKEGLSCDGIAPTAAAASSSSSSVQLSASRATLWIAGVFTAFLLRLH